MLSRFNYLLVCGSLLIILAGIIGYYMGMGSKPNPTYIYLNYETVNNTSSMRKIFKDSGIQLNPQQEKLFQENVKPKKKGDVRCY